MYKTLFVLFSYDDSYESCVVCYLHQTEVCVNFHHFNTEWMDFIWDLTMCKYLILPLLVPLMSWFFTSTTTARWDIRVCHNIHTFVYLVTTLHTMTFEILLNQQVLRYHHKHQLDYINSQLKATLHSSFLSCLAFDSYLTFNSHKFSHKFSHYS